MLLDTDRHVVVRTHRWPQLHPHPWSMPAHGPAGAVTTTSPHAWELDRPGEMRCEEAGSQQQPQSKLKRQGVIVVALPMPMNISRRTAACYREAEADRWATPPTRSRGAWALRIRISTRGGMQKPAAWRPCVVVDGYGLWPDRQRRAQTQLKSERKQ